MAYAVCNGERVYPIEKQLRTILNDKKQAYCLAVLDCCRTEFKEQYTGFQESDKSDPEVDKEVKLIITYGSPVSESIEAKSTISEAYFD